MHLIIFKTNVSSQKDALHLQTVLNAVPCVKQCNFDLEDCDRILRIVSEELQSLALCNLMHDSGFSCEVLEEFVYHRHQAIIH